MKICAKQLIAILFTFNTISFGQASIPKWAHVHKKVFTRAQQKENSAKKEIIFTKLNVQPFSQLIFGWNALRPLQKGGYYSFHARVRDAKTKKWGKWHKMVHWGLGIQRSFQSKSDGVSRYEHVRLELDNGNLADALAIKIEAHDTASLEGLHAFSVTTADLSAFAAEPVASNFRQLKSVYIAQVPRLSQFKINHEDNYKMCSPTSTTMLLNYFNTAHTNPLQFAANSFDTGLEAYGSWPFNTAHAFDSCGGSVRFYPTRLNSFVELYSQLDRGIPVVVSVRGKLPGAPKVYESGHLLVVIGWDSKKQEVICHDPAFKTHRSTLKRYPIKNFLYSWELSRRLAYWAEPVRSF